MKTDFMAGGLKEEPIISKMLVSIPARFTVPQYIDSMPYCLPSSNQGRTPSCAGFATAGFCEVQAWKETNVQTQIDGLKIYNKAKEFDSDKSDGTTLTQAAKAAIDLGFIKGNIKQCGDILSLQYAMHRVDVVVVGLRITSEWNNCKENTGIIPELEHKRVLGGHAVLMCRYNDYGVMIQNSWVRSDGKKWGKNGFGILSWKQFNAEFMSGVVIEKGE